MIYSKDEKKITLLKSTNQALGIGTFACDFIKKPISFIDQDVLEKTVLFFTDSVLCGASALSMQTNAPTILQNEALMFPDENGASLIGGKRVNPQKMILATCSAVREWDSNGTNFGYNPKLNHTAGEFGHNDFYAVPLAAAQTTFGSGEDAVKGMVLLDEIRGRLAEVFSLKTYKIDHVVHGAIASAATWGAMRGATPEQIESAIGMVVAHTIPWRAIRAGKQLSDSKGSSAAISTELAVLFMERSLSGFLGPRDIFRNPEAIFRYFEPTNGTSPFDLVLSTGGSDFSVMGMHFKLGLYEHQSAGALEGIISLLCEHQEILSENSPIKSIDITAYEPAFGIIGDPAKKDPQTRQSADHSMVFIVSRLIRKAQIEYQKNGSGFFDNTDSCWKGLMLTPYDYGKEALFEKETRSLMEKINFHHGGKEFHEKYPDGIPTSVSITLENKLTFKSGLIMYPSGHARNTSANLIDILNHKFSLLSNIACEKNEGLQKNCLNILKMGKNDLIDIFNCTLKKQTSVD